MPLPFLFSPLFRCRHAITLPLLIQPEPAAMATLRHAIDAITYYAISCYAAMLLPPDICYAAIITPSPLRRFATPLSPAMLMRVIDAMPPLRRYAFAA